MNKKFLRANLLLLMLTFCVFITSCGKSSKTPSPEDNKNNTQVINKKTNMVKNGNKTPENLLKNRNFSGDNIKYNDKGIPVLMYHSIDYEEGNELRVSKEKFKEQMEYLKKNNYTTLTLNELYDFFINNKPVPEKSVVITFDDGYKDNYINAYPILKEFSINATIFVVTNNIDKDNNCLTSDQLIELNNNGIDIESHTANHDDLPTLSYENQLKTLKESKTFLEKTLKKEVPFIAYPYGKWTDLTTKAVKEAGFKMAFSTSGTWSDKTDGIYTLDRVYISGNFQLDEFIRRITDRDYNKSH
nr:polysaccharide deacetylase family protein [Clostridium rectalis]